MKNIVLVGYGKMGQVIEEMIGSSDRLKCIGIVDPMREEMVGDLSKLMKGLAEKGEEVHAVIDFSHRDNLEMISKSMEAYPTPLVMATTGFTDEQIGQIESLSKKIPLVFASNYSVGINLMKRIAKEMRDSLGESFDIEIIEKHHNRKVDSPSGTALTLVDYIDPEKEFEREYGREGMRKRTKEIGIHAIRGGTIAGEHTVIFAGENEILEITHKAESNKIFAKGAIRAAGFIIGKAPGLYSMDDVISEA